MEFGLLVAVLVMAATVGLGVLGDAERGYFSRFPQQAGPAPTAAPTAVPTATGAAHMPLVSLFCDKVIVNVGEVTNCRATVQDVYTAMLPSTGTFDWTVSEKGTGRVVLAGASGFASAGLSQTVAVGGFPAGVYVVNVKYAPPVGASGWRPGIEGNTDFQVL